MFFCYVIYPFSSVFLKGHAFTVLHSMAIGNTTLTSVFHFSIIERTDPFTIRSINDFWRLDSCFFYYVIDPVTVGPCHSPLSSSVL